MSSRLNPFAAYRSLALRPRSLLRTHEQAKRLLSRGLVDNYNTRQSPADNSELKEESFPFSENTDASGQDPSPFHDGPFPDNIGNAAAIEQLELISKGVIHADPTAGFKFGIPKRPGGEDHVQHRYSPVIEQVTNLLMRDGKKSKAQRHIALLLHYLRTSPAPKVSPLRPLLPGAPPASHLPLDPVQYLALAIDSVAPLIRVKGLKGLGGGGMSLEIPVPLAVRQRRKLAFQWIMEIVEKKKGRGSGRAQFPTMLGEEIVAIVEGRSSVWQKRDIAHKLGTAARANLQSPKLKKKR